MKEFFRKYKNIIRIILYVEVSLLPTQILLFYREGQFVDIGMLITAVLLIVFTIPVYNIVKKSNDEKKGI